MVSDKPSAYLNALNSKPLRDIKIEPNPRHKALAEQKGKCANCKNEINRAFATFVKDPKTKTYKVLCHNCAISSKLLVKNK